MAGGLRGLGEGHLSDQHPFLSLLPVVVVQGRMFPDSEPQLSPFPLVTQAPCAQHVLTG